MRKTLLIGIPVAAAGVALAVVVARHHSPAKQADAFTQDLQRAQAAGLDLAQAQGANKYALTEIAPPPAAPVPNKIIKKGPGPKAIRSESPSVKAAPEEVDAAVVEALPVTQVVATSESPTPAEIPVPAIPRPTQASMPGGESDGGILMGGVGRSPGRGGIGGVVIRGGGVDGDNCDPRGGAAGTIRRPGVYMPMPTGGIGGTIRHSGSPTGAGTVVVGGAARRRGGR